MRFTLLHALLLYFTFSGFLSAQCDGVFDGGEPEDGQIYISTSRLAGLYNYRLGSFDSFGIGIDAVSSPNGVDNPSVLFANNIWLGALGEDDQIHFAGDDYVSSFGGYPFSPGPLDLALDGDALENGCVDYDRPWIVYGEDIRRHLEDWQEDQDIDEEIPAIMAWPGKGNPHFADIHGFELPENSLALAPFWDFNQDGLYNPLEGDYPWVQGEEAAIPYQMIWSVVNDLNSPLNFDGSANFGAQVGITTWSYDCLGESIAEGVIFTRYTLSNYSGSDYNDFKFGMWTDFDLGCFTDDYVGASSSTRSYYVYNSDPLDGDGSGECPLNFPTFENIPPILSINYLDQTLDAFVVFTQADPIKNDNPSTALETYNSLQGLRSDGNPFTVDFSGLENTPIIFPDTPFLDDGWTMENSIEGILLGETRALAATNLPNWLNGQTFNVTIAYQLHDTEENIPFADNFIGMFEDQFTLFDWYVKEDACELTPACVDDCVWAGDTDANGIVDHFDFLPISSARGVSGPFRNEPIDWSPRSANPWLLDLSNGTNYKHIDADGDGLIEQDEDWEISLLNFKRTNFNYEPEEPFYPLGDDMSFQVIFSNYDPDNASPGDNLVLALRLDESITNLRSFAFNLEYDQSYIESIAVSENQLPENIYIDDNNDGLLEIAIAADNSEDVLQDNGSGIMLFSIRLADEIVEPALSAVTSLELQNLTGIDPNGTYLNLGYRAFTFTFPDIMVNAEEELLDAAIDIYPNPTEANLNIQIGDITLQSFRLLQYDGKQVLHQTISNTGAQNLQLDLEAYPEGIYLIVFEDLSGRRITKRFVKQ